MNAARLAAVVDALPPVAIAVSGGVDSVTLAAFVHRHRGREATAMVHAASPAVPPEVTARVRALGEAEGWDLRVIDAGEFADPRYRANPSNRCFFCKTDLYEAIGRHVPRQMLSGANLDDLGDIRPGLDAARRANVRHPYVEAGLAKAAVRELARALGLGDVAELPSSPCLSSRIETAIAIEPAMLAFVHRTERRVAAALGARTVRCRVRASGIVVELDPDALASADAAARAVLRAAILGDGPPGLVGADIAFEPYRMGSAFMRSGS